MKVQLTDPNPLAGCYTLHLYCDHNNDDHLWDEFPHEYTSERGASCKSKARQDGWVIHKNGTATCPKCA